MPVGHSARQEINLNTAHMKNLAQFGTREMPTWRYPTLLDLVQRGVMDVTPIVAREMALSDTPADLRAFDGPTPSGVAMIADFARSALGARLRVRIGQAMWRGNGQIVRFAQLGPGRARRINDAFMTGGAGCGHVPAFCPACCRPARRRRHGGVADWPCKGRGCANLPAGGGP
jgi:hypothetical protein